MVWLPVLPCLGACPTVAELHLKSWSRLLHGGQGARSYDPQQAQDRWLLEVLMVVGCDSWLSSFLSHRLCCFAASSRHLPCRFFVAPLAALCFFLRMGLALSEIPFCLKDWVPCCFSSDESPRDGTSCLPTPSPAGRPGTGNLIWCATPTLRSTGMLRLKVLMQHSACDDACTCAL